MENENDPQAMLPSEVPLAPPQPPSRDAIAASRKKQAKRRLVIIAVAVVIAGIAIWYFQRSLSLPLQNIESLGNSIGTTISTQIAQNTSTSWPSPLRQFSGAAPKKLNALTDAGVIAQTNLQRAQNGSLLPLAEDATLDDVAALRIDDMFQQQYFAHVGPQGESAVTVASSVGYTHLALGENLALGLYAGDAGVVNAWMNSAGHRANILGTQYTQIGVAVREGTFQGQSTWIAVQIFGRPASDCAAPDANLETTISLSQNQINAMALQLQSDKAAIDAMVPQSGPTYNAQVEDYNDLATQYDNLVIQTKTAIGTYNTEVTAFNTCLAE